MNATGSHYRVGWQVNIKQGQAPSGLELSSTYSILPMIDFAGQAASNLPWPCSIGHGVRSTNIQSSHIWPATSGKYFCCSVELVQRPTPGRRLLRMAAAGPSGRCMLATRCSANLQNFMSDFSRVPQGRFCRICWGLNLSKAHASHPCSSLLPVRQCIVDAGTPLPHIWQHARGYCGGTFRQSN